MAVVQAVVVVAVVAVGLMATAARMRLRPCAAQSCPVGLPPAPSHRLSRPPVPRPRHEAHPAPHRCPHARRYAHTHLWEWVWLQLVPRQQRVFGLWTVAPPLAAVVAVVVAAVVVPATVAASLPLWASVVASQWSLPAVVTFKRCQLQVWVWVWEST